MSGTSQHTAKRGMGLIPVIGAMGIVFGDIGTSPLYAASTTFGVGSSGDAGPSRDYVLGSTSALIYALVLIVTVLYVRFLMRSDNRGEGGLLALLGLLRRSSPKARSAAIFSIVAILGAAMFLGDSVITPAISVLSAVEGLEVIQPGLKALVVPIAVVILIIVFAIQRWGTHVIGRCFGPIMLLWFAAIAVLGVTGITRDPLVLQALSPHWAILFFIQQSQLAFLALGAVVLAITGAEALYADLGHFGRKPISSAWLFVVFPALVLNYLGQASLAMNTPKVAATSFFSLVPTWAQLPMVILATLATIIASQAVISGTYSVIQQAWRLGFFPPLRILHTSARSEGQIYVPAINLLLAVAVIAVTVGFGGSAALASAYGIAVTSTISITIIIYIAYRWTQRRRLSAPILISGVMLIIMLGFLAGNLPKAPTGGWLPLLIGAIVFVVMVTWLVGQRRIAAGRHQNEMDLAALPTLLTSGSPQLYRVPGDAVFITRNPKIVPLALRSLITQNHALQQRAILLSWSTVDEPSTVGADTRVRVESLPDGIVRVNAQVGFLEFPRMTELLAEAKRQPDSVLEDFDPAQTVFYISTPVPRYNQRSRMFRWAQGLFLAIDRLAPDPLDVIELPRDRTIVFGREVQL